MVNTAELLFGTTALLSSQGVFCSGGKHLHVSKQDGSEQRKDSEVTGFPAEPGPKPGGKPNTGAWSSSKAEVLRDPRQADHAHSALLRAQPASLPTVAQEGVFARAGLEATELNSPALMDARGSNRGQWLQQEMELQRPQLSSPFLGFC